MSDNKNKNDVSGPSQTTRPRAQTHPPTGPKREKTSKEKASRKLQENIESGHNSVRRMAKREEYIRSNKIVNKREDWALAAPANVNISEMPKRRMSAMEQLKDHNSNNLNKKAQNSHLNSHNDTNWDAEKIDQMEQTGQMTREQAIRRRASLEIDEHFANVEKELEELINGTMLEFLVSCIDSNSDAALEVQILKAFADLDTDGSGTLTVDELFRGMKNFGMNPTESELRTIMNFIDSDGDGTIDAQEFCKVVMDCFKENKFTDMTYRDVYYACSFFDHNSKAVPKEKMINLVSGQEMCRPPDQPKIYDLKEFKEYANEIKNPKLDVDELVDIMQIALQQNDEQFRKAKADREHHLNGHKSRLKRAFSGNSYGAQNSNKVSDLAELEKLMDNHDKSTSSNKSSTKKSSSSSNEVIEHIKNYGDYESDLKVIKQDIKAYKLEEELFDLDKDFEDFCPMGARNKRAVGLMKVGSLAKYLTQASSELISKAFSRASAGN